MFTNQTPNYGLPQYTSPDELNVLVDFNGAMSTIDTQMKSNELAAQDAKNTAVSASNKADANTLSIQTLNSDINDPATGVGPRVTALEGHVNSIDSLIGNGVPTVGDDTLIGGINANAASIDAINANIGNLEDLDTTDKSSLVGAINELKDDIDNISGYRVVANGTGATLGDKLASVKSAYDALSDADKINSALIINDNLVLRAAGKGSFTFCVTYGSATSINVEIARIISDDYKVLTNTVDSNGFASSDISANTTQSLVLVIA